MTPTTTSAATAAVTRWLERNIGPVRSIEPPAPVAAGLVRATSSETASCSSSCVRGDRTDMPLIFPLDHEMRLQSSCTTTGSPCRAVYGWIDEPMAYVMARVPGRNDFAQSTDAERDAVVDDYLHILARLHASRHRAVRRGRHHPRRDARSDPGTFGMARYEARLPRP